MEINPETDLAFLKERRTEISNNINRILLTLLSFGFFCALTLTQPDEMVIKNGGKIKIPFVSMDVEFLHFLIFGPLALLGITFYLILFMEELRKYDGLPVTEKQVYLFNLNSKAAKVCSSIVFFGFTPLILLMFYIKTRVNPRYAAYMGTLMVLTTVALALYFALQRLRRKETASVIAIILLCGLLLIPISPFFQLNSYVPVSVSGANLANLNLMGFRLAGAQAEKTVFNDSVFYRMELSRLYAPHAQFKNANLIGATLNQSDLGSANFEKAQLSWSSLKSGILANVMLKEAEMVETDLTESVLESANLEKANLNGAIFRMAHLNRARFGEADLSEAVLEGAVLIGTDLGRARNLTQKQLDMACGDKDTILPPGLTVKKCFPD
ncbi:MAG TPA: pentapeptide repeat-containing protein [Desulfobacterales bacterium]|nr:pentapeptide repeat-containing protein [Desulfobacterales bacterium]